MQNDKNDPLKTLEDKIKALRPPAPTPPEENHYSAAQAGWRMVTELVVGVLLGFGVGFGLDSLLGTTPWLMIPLTLLGFAAGVRTMMRTASEIQKKNEDAQ